MTAITTETATLDQRRPGPPAVDPSRGIDGRRLKSPVAMAALCASAVGAVGMTLGTVVAGRLAENPTRGLVWLLAVCLVGAAAVDTTGKVAWVGHSDRAEGRLREDLLRAALRQPLSALNEQAVGEVLDRVDDDTHEVGNLVRWQIWMLARTLFGTLPMWLVAGFTWWPSFVLFPVLGVLTWLVVRSLLGEISRRKVIEEMAWTDHAAVLEEGIAGRDDLRTSLGQAHVLRRVARLSEDVHTKFKAVVDIESRLVRRAGVLLHSLLAGVAVAGVVLASHDRLSVAQLVTLFLVTSTFVGQIAMVTYHLPDLQAGLGAVIRLRQMLAVPPEPSGGRALPDGPLDLELRGLDFVYAEGTFSLQHVDLRVPAGQTVALVGRTGSGKSTLAALISRAMEPPRGTVVLGGADVRDLDLQHLRRSVGVVTQRTEILAGTLAENITLFADLPRGKVEAAVVELGLDAWVAGLPDGLETLLGPGGTSLSAGEEQLVAFARLLVRDVRVVVLDEATARMDPLTERRVVAAADRLLAARTGILVAHRLSTIERAPLVAVLDRGRVVEQGTRAQLAVGHGPFRDLLEASSTERAGSTPAADGLDAKGVAAATLSRGDDLGVGGRRRSGPRPDVPDIGTGPSLARGIAHALAVRPTWGAMGALLFLLASLTGAQGAVTGLLWGRVVEDLKRGGSPAWLTCAVGVSLLAAPVMLANAFWRSPRWWVEVMLRARTAVLYGQTSQRRLAGLRPARSSHGRWTPTATRGTPIDGSTSSTA